MSGGGSSPEQAAELAGCPSPPAPSGETELGTIGTAGQGVLPPKGRASRASASLLRSHLMRFLKVFAHCAT